jgi:AcrR family transcriptional regulator
MDDGVNELAMNEATIREQIVDAAIDLAESQDWESVRLHEIAKKLGISLNDIHAEFSEKDQLIDAWFDRADRAMLADAAEYPKLARTCQQRMHRAIMTWLNALSHHRRVTRQMILGKLEPGHIHIQIPALIRISRTVQWMREAAGYDVSLPRRAVEEAAHTSIYLATFSYWMFDESFGSERTGRFLERQLERANRLFRCRGDQTGELRDIRSAGATATDTGEVTGKANRPG